MPKQITSMEQLKKEAQDEQDAEFFTLLNNCLRNSKRIVWGEDEKRFFVINYIDDFEQELTEKQLMDKSYTNIGFVMEKGSLFKYDRGGKNHKNHKNIDIGNCGWQWSRSYQRSPSASG